MLPPWLEPVDPALERWSGDDRPSLCIGARKGERGACCAEAALAGSNSVRAASEAWEEEDKRACVCSCVRVGQWRYQDLHIIANIRVHRHSLEHAQGECLPRCSDRLSHTLERARQLTHSTRTGKQGRNATPHHFANTPGRKGLLVGASGCLATYAVGRSPSSGMSLGGSREELGGFSGECPMPPAFGNATSCRAFLAGSLAESSWEELCRRLRLRAPSWDSWVADILGRRPQSCLCTMYGLSQSWVCFPFLR